MKPIKVKTYPDGEEVEMVRKVAETETSHRPIYEDADGNLWEPDLTKYDPWYSMVAKNQDANHKEHIQIEEEILDEMAKHLKEGQK